MSDHSAWEADHPTIGYPSAESFSGPVVGGLSDIRPSDVPGVDVEYVVDGSECDET